MDGVCGVCGGWGVVCDYNDVYRFVFFFFEGRGRGVSGEVGVSFEGDE